MISFFNKNDRLFLFIGLSALLIAVLFTAVQYVNLPLSGTKDTLLHTAHWLLVVTATFVLVWILTLSRILFLLTFPILILSSGLLAFATYTQDISFTIPLLESLLNSNLNELNSLISREIIIITLTLLSLSIGMSWIRWKYIKIYNVSYHIVLILISLFLLQFIENQRPQTISRRIPFIFLKTAKDYYRLEEQRSIKRKDITSNLITTQDSKTVVLVLGEAARADHMGINGYSRNTTPNMERFKVISFPKIHSDWTHTNASIPHLLTNADSLSTAPSFMEHSIISLLRKAGYFTAWIGNQTPSSAYIPFIEESDSICYVNNYKTPYNFTQSLDDKLLEPFQRMLNTNHPRSFYVLHMIGSHWYYPAHYPKDFEIYKPTVQTKSLALCDSMAVVNSYDNTIAYTDYILSLIIEELKMKQAIMIFIADHGELLGENGKWLHAQETKFEQNPACFIWFSESFKSCYPEKYDAAKLNRKTQFRTDFLFHSIQNAASTFNDSYNKSLDIFVPQTQRQSIYGIK